jgi:hypothetical protein
MAESFLEEQLERIRQLTEQMSRVARRDDISDEMIRDREIQGYGPLHEVRDVRILESPMSDRPLARDSSARRRRRR